MRKQIRSLNSEEMVDLMQALGEKPFRGKQLFEWVHGKKTASFDEMSNLSKGLRERLSEEFIVDPLRIVKKQQAKDGETAKFLFELPDGECIESVWMRYRHGDSPARKSLRPACGVVDVRQRSSRRDRKSDQQLRDGVAENHPVPQRIHDRVQEHVHR